MGFALKSVSLEASIDVINEKGEGRNVLGWLRAGKKPTKHFIVIGAHIDHVGKGKTGSRAKKKDKEKPKAEAKTVAEVAPTEAEAKSEE